MHTLIIFLGKKARHEKNINYLLSSSNGFLEYFIFKNNKYVFNATAVKLPIIKTMSFFPTP